MTVPDRPDLFTLWQQAGGGTDGYDPERYKELITSNGPVCSCGEPVKPCAPCCRHGGWLHKATDRHECAGGQGHAFPARLLPD